MKANQVTGTTGYRLMAGFDIHNLKVDKVALSSRDVWRVPNPKSAGYGRLASLFGDKSPFDRMAHWIMDQGTSPLADVVYGKITKPPMRFIIIGRDHYREVRNKIHHKKV